MINFKLAILIVVLVGITLMIIELIVMSRKYSKQKSEKIYKYSFPAKLNLATDENKSLYDSLKNKLLNYKNVNSKKGWNNETFLHNDIQIGKLNIRKDIVLIYLPLQINEVNLGKFSAFDCNGVDIYKNVPLRFQVKNTEELEKAFELIELVMKNNNMDIDSSYKNTYYNEQNNGFKKLYDAGLIIDLTQEVPTPEFLAWANENDWTVTSK